MFRNPLADPGLVGVRAGAGFGAVMAIVLGGLLPPALLAGPLLSRGLNGLALGEAAAMHLGPDVQRVKNLAILRVAASVGAAVAITGGIVVPHLLRLIQGPDHRSLLPNAALLGAIVLPLADLV